MPYKFEVGCNLEFDTAEEAIAFAETKESTSVVKFNVEPNAPGRLPKFVYRSCGLWSFEQNRTPQWQAHYIYDGLGEAISEEKPN